MTQSENTGKGEYEGYGPRQYWSGQSTQPNPDFISYLELWKKEWKRYRLAYAEYHRDLKTHNQVWFRLKLCGAVLVALSCGLAVCLSLLIMYRHVSISQMPEALLSPQSFFFIGLMMLVFVWIHYIVQRFINDRAEIDEPEMPLEPKLPNFPAPGHAPEIIIRFPGDPTAYSSRVQQEYQQE